MMDPMFCIRGYEVIRIGDTHYCGSDWCRGITRTCRDESCLDVSSKVHSGFVANGYARHAHPWFVGSFHAGM